jgi:hypothetical protein
VTSINGEFSVCIQIARQKPASSCSLVCRYNVVFVHQVPVREFFHRLSGSLEAVCRKWGRQDPGAHLELAGGKL